MYPFSIYLTEDRTDATAGSVISCGTAPTLAAYQAQAQDDSGAEVFPEKLRPGVDQVVNGQAVYG